MKRTPQSAKMFVGLVALCALAFLGSSMMRWESSDLVRFGCFVLVSMAASRMKVSLPGLNGNMSVNVPFMLLAALELSLAEALIVALVSTLVQCLPKGGKRMSAVQFIFNISLIVNAVGFAHIVARQAATFGTMPEKSLILVLAGFTFFFANTAPVAIVMGLAEDVNVFATWKEIALLTFPFFVLSAGVVSIAATAEPFVGWQIPLAIFPVMVVVFASYRRYFAQARKLEVVPQRHSSSAAAD
ncbi:MAG TPA: hypothetical protein VN577_02770 [Terriglobales bacterium]|nr:hypothetical protein [Terriglobales bacterium]